MGNKVGTVSWTKSYYDSDVERDLKQIMSRHNLVEADPNYTVYEKDMNTFWSKHRRDMEFGLL